MHRAGFGLERIFCTLKYINVLCRLKYDSNDVGAAISMRDSVWISRHGSSRRQAA